MKHIQNRTRNFTIQLAVFTAVLCMLFLLPASVHAQTDSTAQKEKTEVEAPSLMSPTIEFTTVQRSDKSIDLKAAVKTKVDRTFYKIPLLKITFFQMNDTASKELGYVLTDRNGVAVLNVADPGVADKEGKVHFKAVYAGNKSLEPAEEEVSVKRALLTLTPVKGDSSYSMTAKVVDLADGKETPVPEAAITVFVKRSFNPMKLGEGTTDEAGEATVDIPANLPGDENGNLTFIGRVDENETYGNMEATVTSAWGLPHSAEKAKMERALWSKHPPMWMLITFIILITTVWGHYFVIIFELFRLRKEEPEKFANES